MDKSTILFIAALAIAGFAFERFQNFRNDKKEKNDLRKFVRVAFNDEFPQFSEQLTEDNIDLFLSDYQIGRDRVSKNINKKQKEILMEDMHNLIIKSAHNISVEFARYLDEDKDERIKIVKIFYYFYLARAPWTVEQAEKLIG